MLKLKASEQALPITVVLDNARYQMCQLVFGLAKALDIELLYLPSYSPHLNLIERLWKFVRNQCLYSKYYAEFDDFKVAIETCIEQEQAQKRRSSYRAASKWFLIAEAKEARAEPDTEISGFIAKPIDRFKSRSLKRRSTVLGGSGEIAAEGKTPIPSP